ncbi:MAG: YdcH family protein [Stenotrophomonas sp.]|uniref:YdcH family protein n=1 Tax=Stenotrophomonas sp. TaxID=69392 RepID=UPI003D6CE792
MSNLPPANELHQRIAELRAEHRSLDERIARLAANLDDDLEAKRLKRRKLQLKDCIIKLESLLIPDEPA